MSSARIARAIRAIVVAILAAPIAGPALAAWPFAHSSSANTGYVGVMTAPAGAGSVTVPNIGTFAPGTGPVVADDGTLYIGNEQGHLMALRENGEPIWSVTLSGGEPIVASALISRGYIYVVGATETSAALYKFDANGGEVFRSPFPAHRDRVTTTAPNVLKLNPDEFIVVPIAYNTSGTAVYETRLILFAENGQVTVDQKIDTLTPSATGSFGSASIAPGTPEPKPPLPMAAVYTDLTNGEPRIVVADGFQSLVVLKLGGSGLVEARRYRDDTAFRSFTSTPTIMFERSSGRYRGFLANRAGGLMSGDDSLSPTPEYIAPSKHTATSVTMTTWGGLFVWGSELLVDKAGSTDRIPIPGNSIASVAASQNYFYVSSADAFTTFNIVNHQQVSRVDWVGGGLNPPVIGPKGHVYAIASNILFIFPPPKPAPTGAELVAQPLTNVVGIDAQETAPAAPQSTSQLYNPPLTVNGNRLFACEELDQDDCGKGDHRAISLAWCQKQGYPKVQGYDVDSRKVKAEKLDGQFCSKNKCKVFDSIGCEM